MSATRHTKKRRRKNERKKNKIKFILEAAAVAAKTVRNGLQVLFAKVIFQSVRGDGDDDGANKVVHFLMNTIKNAQKYILFFMCRQPLPPQHSE